MSSFEGLRGKLPQIEAELKYSFRNKELLILSFIHRSFVNEHKYAVFEHNERLEFLGDSVLSLIIAEFLYLKYPRHSEGDLSKWRSRLVDASSCVRFIQKLNLGHFVLLGRGEKMNDGRGRETILADLFEAIVGAIYLDGGWECAKRFVFGHLDGEIDSCSTLLFTIARQIFKIMPKRNIRSRLFIA